jgi:hypothetical protein
MPGMLESLLAFLIPQDDAALPLVDNFLAAIQPFNAWMRRALVD